jgi:hypothetical protein
MEIVYKKECWQKIMCWVNESNFEVSGFGTVEIKKDHLLVTEVFLLKQENTSAETELDAEAICKLEYECHQAGVKAPLKLWWHSHVDMAVFWSGTDMKAIKQIGSQGWMVATVFNKKEETRSAIYLSDPFPIFEDDIDTSVEEDLPSQAMMKKWKDEYKEKVSNYTWVPAATTVANGQVVWPDRTNDIHIHSDECVSEENDKKWTGGQYGMETWCEICGDQESACDCPHGVCGYCMHSWEKCGCNEDEEGYLERVVGV